MAEEDRENVEENVLTKLSASAMELKGVAETLETCTEREGAEVNFSLSLSLFLSPQIFSLLGIPEATLRVVSPPAMRWTDMRQWSTFSNSSRVRLLSIRRHSDWSMCCSWGVNSVSFIIHTAQHSTTQLGPKTRREEREEREAKPTSKSSV